MGAWLLGIGSSLLAIGRWRLVGGGGNNARGGANFSNWQNEAKRKHVAAEGLRQEAFGSRISVAGGDGGLGIGDWQRRQRNNKFAKLVTRSAERISSAALGPPDPLFDALPGEPRGRVVRQVRLSAG